jgi:DNA-binding transcriptional LysR family regulator
MDLRQLKYFVAIAEEGGFRRAAARLHITQPPLSLQIRALEKDLGVRLFERGGHTTTLTAAGAALLRRARAILQSLGDAQQETRRIGRGEAGRLVISIMSAALLGRLPPILDTFRQTAPHVDVAIDQRPPKDQVAAIAAGEVDIGLLALSRKARLEHSGVKLASEPLWQEELAVAVPWDHPLAGKAEVSLSALAGERFISITESPEIGFHQQVMRLCMKAGFVPVVRHQAHQLPVALTLIAAGYGVGLVPACMAETWSSLASIRPLAMPAKIAVSIIWRETDPSPAVELFHNVIVHKMAGRYFSLEASMSSNAPPQRRRARSR